MSDLDPFLMARALELAVRGLGNVEPNPLVGCVIARDGAVVGEGWHQKHGGLHAEIEALAGAGQRAAGAALYVTLEPCCHTGKTPPCTRAIIAAGIRRVVCAQQDPFAQVSGGGFAELRAAGIKVETGLLEADAVSLNAPYLKLVRTGRPWTIAKWAMTLDGRIATRSGDSRWISGEASRAIVHRLRGRMDGILVGSGTARADDPLLTARPPGARTATRIVVDSHATLNNDSQLVRTAHDAPVLVAVGRHAAATECDRLAEAGCEIFICDGDDHTQRLCQLLDELGRRRMTNLLIEGGGRVLGTLFDAGLIDEVHLFIAPKIVGGDVAVSPVAGLGIERMADALRICDMQCQQVGEDIYLHGRVESS